MFKLDILAKRNVYIWRGKLTGLLKCLAFAKRNYGSGEGVFNATNADSIFDTVQIDHLGLSMRSIPKNSYILVLADGFTKFEIANSTRTLNTKEKTKRDIWRTWVTNEDY